MNNDLPKFPREYLVNIYIGSFFSESYDLYIIKAGKENRYIKSIKIIKYFKVSK